MVGCFFREDLSIVNIFWLERDLGFCFFCGDSEFGHCSELSDGGGVQEEAFAIASKDSVNESIVQGVLEVLILHIMVKVVIEVRVIDGVYVNILVSPGEGFVKERVISLSVSSMGGVEVLWLITRLGDSQGLFDPGNGGICDMEPGESEDDIFSATARDIEEMLLSDPFDVHVESAGVVNCTSFISSLVHIADYDGGGELLSEESVFSDKLPVYARDVCARIY